MDRNSRRQTTRERRDSRRRSNFFVHLIISVVALLECFLLLTLVSYSWIESSSSLIISTGKGGTQGSIAVAHNLNYQIMVTPGSGGRVKLVAQENNDGTYEGGFFRTTQNFSYAKTSSPNGKDFNFKKNDGTSDYRGHDTTDFNTTFTYLDFEVKNTTGYAKEFCFATGTNDNVFTYTGHSSYDNTYRDIILNAMRFSFEVVEDESGNRTDPLIVSRAASDAALHSYNPVSSPNSGFTTISHSDSPGSTAVRYDSIKAHEYNENATTQNPVFISTPASSDDVVTDRVAVRIWFEEKDSAYAGLQGEAKAHCDEALHAAKIAVNFTLVSDSIDYDTIYFDDYAFSNKVGKEGKFVTDEDENYSMYFHAYNSKDNRENDMPMTKADSSETPANRWTVNVPIQYVVEGSDSYLTGNSPTKWNNAYFYYGNADHSKILYRWNLNSLPSGEYLKTQTVTEDGMTFTQLTDDCSYFRNLGVVRSRSNYQRDDSAIEGYLEYDRYTGSNPMQLTYLRDEATALTGEDFNASSAAALNYRYISNHATQTHDVAYQTIEDGSGGGESGSGSGGSGSSAQSITLDYSDVVANPASQTEELKSRLFYFDVPAGTRVWFTNTQIPNKQDMSSYSNNLMTEDTKTYVPNDGDCFTVSNVQGNNNNVQPLQHNDVYAFGYSCNNLPELNSTSDGWIRIYFFLKTELNNTGNSGPWKAKSVYIQTYGSSGVADNVAMTSIKDQVPYVPQGSGSDPDPTPTPTPTDQTYQRYKGGIYLNLRNSDSYEESAMKTISTYYDPDSERFKAYVPQSWLNSGFDTHYNELDGFYELASDKIRWATGASSSDTYSLLGYTDASTVADMTAGTGVGTWDTIRRMQFSNELLYTNVGTDVVYKLGKNSAQYPMAPDPSDELNYHYFAYVPVTGLSTQISNAANNKLCFTRYAQLSDSTASGWWYPQENITSKETTYYAVDAQAESSGSESAKRGWFHVAVFVDGTFENIVYDTLYGSDAESGAKLEYSPGGSSFNPVVISNSTDSPELGTDVKEIGTTRWVVPLSSGVDLVTFRWTPYPSTNTVFSDYTIDLSKGIYCVVSEAN